MLNPKRAPQRFNVFRLRAMVSIVRHGMPQLKQAVAGGQYELPQGLFFGGKALSQSGRILAEHLPRWVARAARVVHIDFHTGLGRWATYQLLVDVGLDPRLYTWSRESFGSRVVHSDPARSIAYQARGDLAAVGAGRRFPERTYDLPSVPSSARIPCNLAARREPGAFLGPVRSAHHGLGQAEPPGGVRTVERILACTRRHTRTGDHRARCSGVRVGTRAPARMKVNGPRSDSGQPCFRR